MPTSFSRQASPLTYASAGDPPVILFYKEPNVPLPADAKPGEGIHHPRFGEALKSKLDPLGVECILRHSADYPKQDDPNEVMFREMLEFFGDSSTNRKRMPSAGQMVRPGGGRSAPSAERRRLRPSGLAHQLAIAREKKKK